MVEDLYYLLENSEKMLLVCDDNDVKMWAGICSGLQMALRWFGENPPILNKERAMQMKPDIDKKFLNFLYGKQ